MKKTVSKNESEKKIDEFFQREDFSGEEVKKMKRFAMKFNIKLGRYKKLFCKKCLSKLEGKIKVGKKQKTVACKNCGFRNRIRLT